MRDTRAASGAFDNKISTLSYPGSECDTVKSVSVSTANSALSATVSVSRNNVCYSNRGAVSVSEGSLSTGAIAGIIVGCLAFVAIGMFVILVTTRKYREWNMIQRFRKIQAKQAQIQMEDTVKSDGRMSAVEL